MQFSGKPHQSAAVGNMNFAVYIQAIGVDHIGTVTLDKEVCFFTAFHSQ